TLAYFADAITGAGLVADQTKLGEHFAELTANPVLALGFQWLFLLINGLIVAFGVTKGIERVSKILMPMLFVMMLVIIVRGLMLPGAMGGVEFLFKFDLDAFTWEAMLQAMGFTFFSLCVGCGCMLTYGSYLPQETNLINGCSWIAFLGVVSSLLGGLMIMPSVFAFGLDPSAGPGLTFIT
ncbi:Sodium:neurotransmitter symporter family protein, partial [gut metagenome]